VDGTACRNWKMDNGLGKVECSPYLKYPYEDVPLSETDVGIIPLLTVAIAFVLNIQMMFYKHKTKVIEKPVSYH
jgi:hypothetical protein